MPLVAPRLQGPLYMMGAVFCFTFLDSTAKWLGQNYAISQIVWARYLGGFLFALAFTWRGRGLALARTRRPVHQVARGCILLLCTGANFLALRYLPLAEVTAILFTTPLWVCALSVPLLGEKVGWRRWTAILVGFAGVLLIVRPGLGALHWAVLVSLTGALLSAFYNLFTRSVATHDPPQTSLFYVTGVGALLSTPLAFLEWRTPEGLDLLLFLWIGGIASLGHFLLIKGHGLAPASTLAPFGYTQILWTTTVGWIVFHQLPDFLSFVGAAVVVASGLFLLYRERALGKRLAAEGGRDS